MDSVVLRISGHRVSGNVVCGRTWVNVCFLRAPYPQTQNKAHRQLTGAICVDFTLVWDSDRCGI